MEDDNTLPAHVGKRAASPDVKAEPNKRTKISAHDHQAKIDSELTKLVNGIPQCLPFLSPLGDDPKSMGVGSAALEFSYELGKFKQSVSARAEEAEEEKAMLQARLKKAQEEMAMWEAKVEELRAENKELKARNKELEASKKEWEEKVKVMKVVLKELETPRSL